MHVWIILTGARVWKIQLSNPSQFTKAIECCKNFIFKVSNLRSIRHVLDGYNKCKAVHKPNQLYRKHHLTELIIDNHQKLLLKNQMLFKSQEILIVYTYLPVKSLRTSTKYITANLAIICIWWELCVWNYDLDSHCLTIQKK